MWGGGGSKMGISPLCVGFMGKSQKTSNREAVGNRIAVGLMGNPQDCRKAGD